MPYASALRAAASVLRIPTTRETVGKNVKDNGMCRVAHAWLRGMRPRNGTSVSHGVCHETRGLIARNRLSRRSYIERGFSSPPLDLFVVSSDNET